MVEWNSGTVELWNSGMAFPAVAEINNECRYIPETRVDCACANGGAAREHLFAIDILAGNLTRAIFSTIERRWQLNATQRSSKQLIRPALIFTTMRTVLADTK